MRVLLVTDSPQPSGVGEHMLTLARALGDQGVDAALAFPDHDAGVALAGRAAAAGLSAQVVKADGWEVVFAPSSADVVHVHAGIGWEGHALTSAASQTGTCVIRTEHLPWLLNDPAQIAAYVDASRHVDYVIAVSRSAARSWQRAMAELPQAQMDLAIVANGIALAPPYPSDRKAQSPRDRRPVILCIGRFTAQKMHRTLLAAFARLHLQGISARLRLVGDGPGRQTMERMAAKLGLRDCVEFLGSRDDIPALMADADLLALSSKFEGLPLVVLEAMAVELPVVATASGGTADALGPDHPWLVPVGDTRALAHALAQALSDPDLRARVAQAQAARFHASFTAGRMAAQTARLYRKAVAKRAAQQRFKKDRVMKIGFIGAGGIAHRHFGVLQTMPDVSITALADPHGARVKAAAAHLGARAYPDHDAMLAAEDLDAVWICIPPFAHGAPERACLARGLPFFVEKPITLDLALAEQIATEVEAAGLITAVGYHWRYLDTVDEARAHLAKNPAHLMQGFWLDQTPPPQWWWREDASGGQVVEQATHLIDAARFLAGDVTEVFAMDARRDRADFAGLTVPTATTATLRFASGAVANLAATCLLRWNHRVALHVFSDALAMEITDHDLMVDTGQGRPIRSAEGDPVWRQDRDFIEAVRGGDNRIRCPYGDALETHRVALAVSQSARSGTLVRTEGLRVDPQPIFRRPAAQSASHAPSA